MTKEEFEIASLKSDSFREKFYTENKQDWEKLKDLRKKLKLQIESKQNERRKNKINLTEKFQQKYFLLKHIAKKISFIKNFSFKTTEQNWVKFKLLKKLKKQKNTEKIIDFLNDYFYFYYDFNLNKYTSVEFTKKAFSFFKREIKKKLKALNYTEKFKSNSGSIYLCKQYIYHDIITNTEQIKDYIIRISDHYISDTWYARAEERGNYDREIIFKYK